MNATTFFPPAAIAALALFLPTGTTPVAPASTGGPTVEIATTLVGTELGITTRLLQDDPAAEESKIRPEVAYFTPKHLHSGTLMNNAQQLVYNSEVLGELPRMGFQPVAFQQMDDMLVVAALPELMPGVLDLLRELDDQAGGDRDGDSSDESRVATFQYQLRYASHSAVQKALEPFRNYNGSPRTTMPDAPTGITIVSETGTVIVRETVAMIAEIRRVLEEIDQPPAQVRLTYYLVRGYTYDTMFDEGFEPEQMNVGVPEELVRDLGDLLPVEGFRMLSFGVLQGDALAAREFSDDFDGQSLNLSMYPSTFDRQTGALGLAQVEFSLRDTEPGPVRSKSFSTSAQLEPGRYTVLGGVGADPMFVVLRMTRM